MVVNISRASEKTLNKVRARIMAELLYRGRRGAESRYLSPKVSMTSKQLGMFLKRMKSIQRRKGSRGYRYFVELPEAPDRIEYGKEWVEIDEVEKDGVEYIRITSSRKKEKLVLKKKQTKR